MSSFLKFVRRPLFGCLNTANLTKQTYLLRGRIDVKC